MIHFSDIKADVLLSQETAAADTNFCGELGAAQPVAATTTPPTLPPPRLILNFHARDLHLAIRNRQVSGSSSLVGSSFQ